MKRKRKPGNDKRPSSTTCPSLPSHDNFPISKTCYRCSQSSCICPLETTGLSKLSAGGGSTSWPLSQGSAVAAAAAAAAAASSWSVAPSITITPPPLTHHLHHHQHHLSSYHHHHSQTGASSSGSLQQPLSSGRGLDFPQYPDSASTAACFPNKLPAASGGCSTAYPASASSEGFFKPSDIFHLDYYDHTSQSSSSNTNNNVTSRHHHHHPSYYGCNSGPPYSDYTGGSSDNLIADATLHSLSAGPPWSIQSMPYANSFIGPSNNNSTTSGSGAGSSSGNSSITNNSSSGNNGVGTSSAGLWAPKSEVNGGSYLSSISAEYSNPEFYPPDCFNYYIDNNNYCWTQQQSIANQGSSNIYPWII